jgi:hypothetical protein
MSDAPDPLERELAALTPPAVSPELRQRIADRLARPPAWRRAWPFALAGGLIVASVAAVLVWDRSRHAPRDEPRPVVVPQSSPAVAPASPEPTLLVYRRALARSPEELDAVLGGHATLAPDPNPKPVAAGAFARSDVKLRALLGDD